MLPDLRGWRKVLKLEFPSGFNNQRFMVLIAIYCFVTIAGAYGSSTGGPFWDVENPSMDLFILSTISTFFAGIFGVSMAFDSFYREKVQGTFDTLLVHPVSRHGIFLGKTFGMFVPLYFGMALINTIGVMVIVVNAGSPPFVQALTFIFLTPFVALFFISLLNAISFSKPASRSLMYGLLLWLFFSPFIWAQLLVPSLAYASGIEVTDETRVDIESEFNVFGNFVDMFNPMLAPVGMVAVTGDDEANQWLQGVPDPLPFVSTAVWIMISMFIGLRSSSRYGIESKRPYWLSWLPHIGQ